MLSRWYNLFIGMVLVVMGIVGYIAPSFLTADVLPSWVPTVWLLTGLVTLLVGFVVRNLNTERWVAGIVGTIYLLWGLIALFTEGPGVATNPMSFLMFVIGALGLSASLVPATWMHETYKYNESRT